MDKAIKELKDVIKVQCMSGNWNYDPYMHGMANGLICALAILTGKEPNYLHAPDEWLCNRPNFEAVSVSNENPAR